VNAPVLEGSLRELALADVLQLLELGRRTGVLRVDDEARGLAGDVALADGAVTGARLGARAATREADVQAIVCALLEARVGRFAFVPALESLEDAPARASVRRVRVEAILVEAARRADEWARLTDLMPHPAAVPTLTDGGAIDPLTLDARQWALLAEVDGARDVVGLAAGLGRDPLELAGALAELARLGLVACGAAPVAASDGVVPSAQARSSTW
jgi:hypothetical protein